MGSANYFKDEEDNDGDDSNESDDNTNNHKKEGENDDLKDNNIKKIKKNNYQLFELQSTAIKPWLGIDHNSCNNNGNSKRTRHSTNNYEKSIKIFN